jgi:hypothetical protein
VKSKRCSRFVFFIDFKLGYSTEREGGDVIILENNFKTCTSILSR